MAKRTMDQLQVEQPADDVDDEKGGTDVVSVRLPRAFVRRIRELAQDLDVNLNSFLGATFFWGDLQPKNYALDECLADFQKVLGGEPAERVVLRTWDAADVSVLDAACVKLAEAGLIEHYARKSDGPETIATFALTLAGTFVAEQYLQMAAARRAPWPKARSQKPRQGSRGEKRDGSGAPPGDALSH